MAAALTFRGSPFRAKPCEYASPDEFNRILRTSFFAAFKLDDHAYSESIMMIHLYSKLKPTNLAAGPVRELATEFSLHEEKAKKIFSTANVLAERVNKLLTSWHLEPLEYDRLRVDKDFIVLMRVALLWSSDGSVMRMTKPPKLHPSSAKANSVLFELPISVEKIRETFDPRVCPQEAVHVQERYLHILRVDENVPTTFIQTPVEVARSFFNYDANFVKGVLIWFESSVVLSTRNDNLIRACDVVICKMKKTSGVSDADAIAAITWSEIDIGAGVSIYCTELRNIAMSCHDDAREFSQVFNTFCEIVCVNCIENAPIYLRTFGTPQVTSEYAVACLQQTLNVPIRLEYAEILQLPTFKVLRFHDTISNLGDVKPSPLGMNYLNFLTARDKRRNTLYVGQLDHRLMPNEFVHNIHVPINTYVRTERAKWELLDAQVYLSSTEEEEADGDIGLWRQAHTDTWSALAAMHPTIADPFQNDRIVFGITNHSLTIERGDYVLKLMYSTSYIEQLCFIFYSLRIVS